MATKKEQRQLMSVFNNIEEVIINSKCKENNTTLRKALNIIDDMIDEDIFQELEE